MSGSAGGVSCWISLLWFTAAVGSAACDLVTLETPSRVLASCGDNVTLTCNVSSLQMSQIMLLAWLDGKSTLCQLSNGQMDPGGPCKSRSEPSHHSLMLTLFNVMPVNKGKYICKLRSSLEARSNTTELAMKPCLKGQNSSVVNSSHVQCQFIGVYPRGTVHWVQGDDNLTDAAITEDEEGHEGWFNIWSSVSIERGNESQPYRCSLCVPAGGKCLSSQLLTVRKSAGDQVDTLHWIYFLLQMMIFKSVT